jgi:hypothetical protein
MAEGIIFNTCIDTDVSRFCKLYSLLRRFLWNIILFIFYFITIPNFMLDHHHRPLIPLCGVGTTCFLLPLSSITCHLHAHSFCFHVILHKIHLFLGWPLLGCPSTSIVITLCYVTFIPPHNMPILVWALAWADLLLLILCYFMLDTYIHTYMPLTLYPLRGSRGISDIPSRRPRFTKII